VHHHHRHRARPVVALLLLLALLATACGSSDSDSASADTGDDDAPTTVPAAADLDLSGVTLRVGDLGGTQKAGLEASGEGKDLPYKIEWSQFPAGPPAIEALNAGAIDFAVMGDTPPIFAQAGGVDTKIVSVAHPREANQPYLQIIVPEDSSIETVKDLKGKTIAVSQQTIMQYFLIKALEKEGLSLDDVKPAFLLPQDAAAAYTSGDADAFVSIEPLTTITNGQKKSRAIADSADYFVSQSFGVARGKALEDPKVAAALGDYLQRVVRTYRWTLDNIDEWVPAYVAATKFPETLAGATIASTGVEWQPIDDEVISIQQDQIDTWAEAGLAPDGLKADDEFDDRYNALIQEASK
jgi:sulfonate transport system substrate-binding protein